jgi:hypothetical protein
MNEHRLFFQNGLNEFMVQFVIDTDIVIINKHKVYIDRWAIIPAGSHNGMEIEKARIEYKTYRSIGYIKISVDSSVQDARMSWDRNLQYNKISSYFAHKWGKSVV